MTTTDKGTAEQAIKYAHGALKSGDRALFLTEWLRDPIIMGKHFPEYIAWLSTQPIRSTITSTDKGAKGRDAMESFSFGKDRATEAIIAALRSLIDAEFTRAKGGGA